MNFGACGMWTSSAVTGSSLLSTEPLWAGKDKCDGNNADNVHNLSLTLALSLTILPVKKLEKSVQSCRFSSSVLVLSVSWLCSRSLTIFQRSLLNQLRWCVDGNKWSSTRWSADSPSDTLGGTQTDHSLITMSFWQGIQNNVRDRQTDRHDYD